MSCAAAKQKTMKTLRLILGDQLNYQHSWFKQQSSEVVYVIMELRQETDYVLHHAQKLLGFFAAMNNFSEYLKKRGHQVIHLRINDQQNKQDLCLNLLDLFDRFAFQKFEYQLPDEYRLDTQLKTFCASLNIASAAYDSEHFYTHREELKTLFAGKKTYLMESFYRYMRKKHGVLMSGETPVGGQWNYDKENREPFKTQHSVPAPLEFSHNYSEIWQELKQSGAKWFGEPRESEFPWPSTRKQSLALLDYFVEHALPLFGRYQDAMTQQHSFLFHSRLSFALNIKMISPREVVQRVENAWRSDPESIPLSSAEGFIRQIIGWREYMRGIYWAEMPAFKTLNFFKHHRELPVWFWTGDTRMNCLSQSIRQSLNHAYAHHIQRLMVTGNFALLAGISPDAVDRWYLGIYIDAVEWVEITNTRGMSQFADGGKLATKPYVSGAAYIHKMSDYCKTCSYDRSKRHGDKACPFNSLYWRFFEEHRSLLNNNIRLAMMFSTWDKMDPEEKKRTLAQAEIYLDDINHL